jgi:hypothetical protein
VREEPEGDQRSRKHFLSSMERLFTHLRRLSALTPAEVRERGSQLLAAFAERHGYSSLAKLPDDQSILATLDSTQIGRQSCTTQQFLDYFRPRTKPKFFSGFLDKEATIQELRRWPNAERQITERANCIVDGRFDLLGFRGLSFGKPINWHLEPISGKRVPLIHWSKLDYLNVELVGDKKIIWELNRHQYLTMLGQAYWLTQDERYAKTFVSHLESWMDQNPPKFGINWASSLEVAFRSISWLWALYFFKDSRLLTSRILVRALKFLYLNARHLETYLSTYFSPNTHLTGEALGLFYLGTLLPEFKEARRWRDAGREILLRWLPRHVKTDGVYFEQSSYYHRYTTDFYIHFLILSRANGEPVPVEVEQKLRLMLDHLMYITRPDGTTPLIGDDDGGRLLMLDRRPRNDFRATLSTGAALFERPDYKFVASDAAEETLWLLGLEGLNKLDRIPAREPATKSVAFERGGYYVMRDGWTTTSNYLLFDCGPHGQANCGHAHADALAFDLAANGRTLLVDPGTYTYTGSKDLRDWFRGSSAHNTLTVGQQSSSVSAEPFSWKSVARCETRAWISNDRFDYVAGAHDGYVALPQPAEHDRSILFLKSDYWVVRDHIKSASEQLVNLWFHFQPDSDLSIQASAVQPAFIAEGSDETGLDVYAFAENSHWRWEEGWVSHCYGQKDPSRVYVFSTALGGGRNAFTFLLPRANGARSRVTEIEAIGGQAFEVANENWLDIVMIRTGERIETARITSDFEWTWARFSRDDRSLPEELVLIGGGSLWLDGREIVRLAKSTTYLAARRADNGFHITGDEGSGLRTGDFANSQFET